MAASSLFTLCIQAVSQQLIYGGDSYLEENIFELPAYLFDNLTINLPPMALHKLQQFMSSADCSESSNDGFVNEKKRGRYGDLNTAWKVLFKTRWPEGVKQSSPWDHSIKQGVEGQKLKRQCSEWHQIYWESHLQECLDIAAEKAVLPSSDGHISETKIPGNIMESIGHKKCICSPACGYSKLSYHCQEFQCYARCLRLQSVLCVTETCDLLKGSKLQSLVLRRIKSEEHVNGACRLLMQNNETLSSLDFIYCKLPSTALNAICDSLFVRGIQTHGIQYFSIKASDIVEKEVRLPSGVLSFLSSGRSLQSLKFCDNKLGPSFARTVFDTLLDSSSDLSVLDLSENNISGWLSNFTGIKSLWSLRVLNLRGNNLQKDDASSLRYGLLKMPNLECLDISDNPIEDSGLRSLIPYFEEISERNISSFKLKIESCDLSYSGATLLLRILSHMKGLNALSIAYNELGSRVAVPLAEFLGESCVKVLNIEGIDFGSSGFQELTKKIPEKINLVEINISKNRGGIETASFVSKLILRSPELVDINAEYNFMPEESLVAIYSALKLLKGKLERLDLSGNTGCYQPAEASILSEFRIRGRPIVILPLPPFPVAPYDDEP
ncbi:hypothetical protein ACHQM5_013970 [Ranunculus cassubicifolius]